MSMIVLKLLESIVKGNHPIFHFTDWSFDEIFKLIDLLNLLILSLHHKFNLILSSFFKLRELIYPIDHLFINSLLQIVKLIDFFFIDSYYSLHPLYCSMSINMNVIYLFIYLRYFVVLQLNIGRFICLLSLKKEIMIFYFFWHRCLNSLDLIQFYRVLSLLLIERLKQFAHDLSHFCLYLIPLKLFDFLALLLIFRHYFYLYNQFIDDWVATVSLVITTCGSCGLFCCSLSCLFSLFLLSEFLLVGPFLLYGCLKGSVAIIVLIEPKEGEVDWCPKREAKTEHKDLIGPTVVEKFSQSSPSSFDIRLRVPLRYNLGLSSWMRGKVPKTGLTVCE